MGCGTRGGREYIEPAPDRGHTTQRPLSGKAGRSPALTRNRRSSQEGEPEHPHRGVLNTRCRGTQRVAVGPSRGLASCPLSQREGKHAYHSSPGRARRGHHAHGAGRVRAGERRVRLRPEACQGRRHLALGAGHRRPGPQRAVRLRRRRPLHRRCPRPRCRRQVADPRQGDHQGGRQERRLLHGVRAQCVRRSHRQGRRARALAGQEPPRLRWRRPGRAARGPRGDRRAEHRPHRGRLRPDRRVRR